MSLIKFLDFLKKVYILRTPKPVINLKRFLLLFFLFPFLLSAQVAQECTTITSVINADSIVICVDSVSCNAICDGRIEIDVYP